MRMQLSLQEVTDMPLPPDVHALSKEIARGSLRHSFRQAFDEEPPDYLLRNPRAITLLKREWHENYAQEVALLVVAAGQALRRPGLQDVLVQFTSSVVSQPELDRFMRNNPYLTKLVSDSCRDERLFRALLTLLTELGR